MPANGSTFIIYDPVTPKLAALAIGFEAGVESAMERFADEVLNHAQEFAPWEDRTGDARAGLDTDVRSEGGDIVLTLFHTVDYGQWLETIQNGRFATILPTLEAMAPHFGFGLRIDEDLS